MAAAVVLAVVLSGCGGDGDGGGEKPPTAAPSSSRAEPEPAGSGPVEAAMLSLGEGIETLGSEDPVEGSGGGVLELTPSSVVYLKKTFAYEPVNGLFVVVAYKARPTTAVAAAETAPIDSAGWQWVAPDGQAVSTMDGDATSVVPDGFSGGGPVQPGTFEWRSVAFDISESQRGGTLLYVDGEGASFRWKVPAKDTGPEAAKVKVALE